MKATLVRIMISKANLIRYTPSLIYYIYSEIKSMGTLSEESKELAYMLSGKKYTKYKRRYKKRPFAESAFLSVSLSSLRRIRFR